MESIPERGPELEALWRDAVEAVSTTLPMSDRAFILRARPLARLGQTIVVLVPDDLTRRQVEDRSAGHVARVLSDRLGTPITVATELVADDQTTTVPAGINDASSAQPDRVTATVPEQLPASHEPAASAHASPARTAPRSKADRLNPRYTFDNFVIGPSNRFAHAAAVAAAEAPGKAYNPLLIYGESGLGKTHLLHAIGHYARHLFDGVVVRYGSSEEFTNEFINSIRDDRSRSFQQIYRNVDFLLIDDIQFLEGKEQTQEEFFHTFNTLYNANKQIVITSDRPPKELANLEERLRNRFSWGLMTDVQPPDLETRIAILSKKAQAEGIRIPGDVLELIAGRITRNIRELEGALVRVAALANLQAQPIDLPLANEALRDLVVDDASRTIAPELIMRITADYFGFDVDDLVGRSRKQPLATCRQVAMYLCRELTELSLPRIGEVFGGRDHTTVMHATKVIKKDLSENRETWNQLAELTSRVKQASNRG